jgi:hypothetical protein
MSGVQYPVLFHQPAAFLNLIGRRLPCHVEDLIARSDEALRVAVAVHAPFHL